MNISVRQHLIVFNYVNEWMLVVQRKVDAEKF